MKQIIRLCILWSITICIGFVIVSSSSQNGEQTAGISEKIVDFLLELFSVSATQLQYLKIEYIVRQTLRVCCFGSFGFFFSLSYNFSASLKDAVIIVKDIPVKYTFSSIAGRLWVIIPFCVLFSFFDEWRKQFIPGRHFDEWEAFLNIISVSAGVFLAIFIFSWYNKKIHGKQLKI